MVHVLVVEDSPTQAARLCAELESAGFEVSAATNGAEALQQLESTRFDIVISDVVMPGVTGYELCRTIKDDPRLRDIPVILLTSLGDPLEVVNGLESGADNFIRKPYETEQVVSRLRSAVSNRELRSKGRFQVGVQLSFLDREFEITADRQQILDLLISTFEELVMTSREIRQRERDLEQAHAKLAEQLDLVELERKRLSAVVDAVPVPLFVTSAGGSVSHVSKASGRTLQADLDTVLGSRLDDVVSCVDADDRPVASSMLPHHRAAEDGTPATSGESFDLFVARPDGARVPVVLQASPILDDARRSAGCVTTIHTLGGLTEHDPLTGLPTAATFLDRAAGLLSLRQDPAGLLVIELDHFDVIQASLSTSERNDIVLQAARGLRQVLDARPGTESDGDSLLGYLGGKRFGVLLTDLPDSFLLMQLAESARRVISSAGLERAGRVITASVGVAVSDGAQQGTHLFAAASEAVAKAVRRGGDRVETVGVSAAREAMDRLQLAVDLRAAIDRDEIELHFQPEYELSSGELVGFEALARWHHPRLGPIAPPVFIGLAEQSGQIVTLGRQLMRRACFAAQSWTGLRTPPSVAVNVSAIQLRAEFVGEAVAVLEETGLDPSRLLLEITETAAMSDPGQTVPVIEELRRLGVRFSLDDFGTGYSSLTQLTRLQFDQLKLDRSFVALIDQPGPSAVVAKGVLGLARSLNVPVVAEGVETQEQLDVLAQLSCAIGQGYLFSRPIPGELVDDYLARTVDHDGRALCRSHLPTARRAGLLHG